MRHGHRGAAPLAFPACACVDGQSLLDKAVDAIPLFHADPTGCAESPRKAVVFDIGPERGGKSLVIVHGNGPPGLPWNDDVCDVPHERRCDSSPGGHRLKHHVGGSFVMRGQGQDMRGGKKVLHVGPESQEFDGFPKLKLAGQLAEPRFQGSLARDTKTEASSRFHKDRGGTEEHVPSFLGVQAPNADYLQDWGIRPRVRGMLDGVDRVRDELHMSWREHRAIRLRGSLGSAAVCDKDARKARAERPSDPSGVCAAGAVIVSQASDRKTLAAHRSPGVEIREEGVGMQKPDSVGFQEPPQGTKLGGTRPAWDGHDGDAGPGDDLVEMRLGVVVPHEHHRVQSPLERPDKIQELTLLAPASQLTDQVGKPPLLPTPASPARWDASRGHYRSRPMNSAKTR